MTAVAITVAIPAASRMNGSKCVPEPPALVAAVIRGKGGMGILRLRLWLVVDPSAMTVRPAA